MAHGLWIMAFGCTWKLANRKYGLWIMEHGLWIMDHGLRIEGREDDSILLTLPTMDYG